MEAARLFSGYGVTRMVMARELSLNEMKRIREETGMELEAFVHGALCYCYSGQCLFSSMLGGRSGNRGRCAQPCRLPYAVLDEKHREYKKDAYVLSLKDMCGIKDLRGLADAGVYSLKIEGRMKQIPYAAGVVSYYRKYIDLFLSGQETQVSEGSLHGCAHLPRFPLLPPSILLNRHCPEYKKDAYVLSLKDMCGIKDLRGLADAGVYSLKI